MKKSPLLFSVSKLSKKQHLTFGDQYGIFLGEDGNYYESFREGYANNMQQGLHEYQTCTLSQFAPDFIFDELSTDVEYIKKTAARIVDTAVANGATHFYCSGHPILMMWCYSFADGKLTCIHWINNQWMEVWC